MSSQKDHDVLLRIEEHVKSLPDIQAKLEQLTMRVTSHGVSIKFLKWGLGFVLPLAGVGGAAAFFLSR